MLPLGKKVINIEDDEIVADYIHGDGRIGVLVKLKVSNPGIKDNDKLKELAFDLALHIAAFSPLCLSRDKVDEEYIKEQEEIYRKQAQNLGKPEKILEGIVKGKLNKHFSSICLLDQGFVKEEKTKTLQIIKNLGQELGSDIEISDFLYYKVGSENK